MADFVLSSVPWSGENLGFESVWGDGACFLSIETTVAPRRVAVEFEPPFGLVILAQDPAPKRVLAAIRSHAMHFIDAIGVCSGALFHTQTGEIVAFRDVFGWIPLLVTQSGSKSFCLTSSPWVHESLHEKSPIDARWISDFIASREYYSNTGKDSRFVFERREPWKDAFRLLPGEARYFGHRSLRAFLSEFSGKSEIDAPTDEAHECDVYWRRRHYSPCALSFEDAAVALAEAHRRAVATIPNENPVFAISGGLDSTGITAAHIKLHGLTRQNPASAFSLVSSRHRSCDESHELDILERELPIKIRRFDMDETPSISDLELVRRFAGYGPLCAPALEINLHAYRRVAPEPATTTIIFGYGGNYLVKARPEAVLRDLIQRREWVGAADVFMRCKKATKSYLFKRFVAYYLAKWAKLEIIQRRASMRGGALNRAFREKYPQAIFDEVYPLTQVEERAQLYLSRDWEVFVRAIDAVARAARQFFYDPLFSPELYDFCSQMPPQFFFDGRVSRALYKAALSPLLPPGILHHPKVQSFDANVDDVLARNLSRSRLRSWMDEDFTDLEGILAFEERFRQDPASVIAIDYWRVCAVRMWRSMMEGA